ncbi:cupin domain-containing protein [Burkholderia sp. JPY481]|uniref:cupin domain-containing protein n=1 Tax=Paraburkholderia sp. JPY465 TaxID=3042285 RepID=UPI00317B7229
MTEPVDPAADTGASGFQGVTRRVLERMPMPGSGQELVLTEVTYPPGGVAPLHAHPVGGIVYILEGVAESAYGSDAPRRYSAGASLQDRTDVPHTLFRNCDPERPLRFLTICALEPGQSYVIEL